VLCGAQPSAAQRWNAWCCQREQVCWLCSAPLACRWLRSSTGARELLAACCACCLDPQLQLLMLFANCCVRRRTRRCRIPLNCCSNELLSTHSLTAGEQGAADQGCCAESAHVVQAQRGRYCTTAHGACAVLCLRTQCNVLPAVCAQLGAHCGLRCAAALCCAAIVAASAIALGGLQWLPGLPSQQAHSSCVPSASLPSPAGVSSISAEPDHQQQHGLEPGLQPAASA